MNDMTLEELVKTIAGANDFESLKITLSQVSFEKPVEVKKPKEVKPKK